MLPELVDNREPRELGIRRAAIARAHRRAKNHPDDPAAAQAVSEARASYYAATLETHIRRIVAKAPPFSPGQVDELSLLLREVGGRDG